MRKNLQDRMLSLKNYFRSIESYNDAIIVKVQFPPKWTVTGSVDGVIKVVNSDTTPGEYFYYGDINNTSYDDIFDVIEETVSTNETAIKKLQLLKDKVEELKLIFSNPENTFDELANITFTFQPKDKKKKPRNKKKIDEVKVEEIKENINDMNNEVIEENNE